MDILVNFQSEDCGGHVGSPNMLAFELRMFIILLHVVFQTHICLVTVLGDI